MRAVVFRTEGVVEVVLETGVRGDLLPQLHHLVEDVLESFRFLQPAVGHQFPSLLAQGAFRLFKNLRHLRQRFLLAAKFHGE